MLLAGDAEVERARCLGDLASVRIEVSQSTLALRDLGGDTKPVPRMRIKCVDEEGITDHARYLGCALGEDVRGGAVGATAPPSVNGNSGGSASTSTTEPAGSRCPIIGRYAGDRGEDVPAQTQIRAQRPNATLRPELLQCCRRKLHPSRRTGTDLPMAGATKIATFDIAHSHATASMNSWGYFRL